MQMPCKICNSELKEEIEKLILQGHSNTQIAIYLQSKGMVISHASVNRHKRKHMPEHEETIKALATPIHNTKYDRCNGLPINPIETLDKAVKMRNSVRKFKIIYDHMQLVLTNQVTIVLNLQNSFMKNESRYPYEEVRGLYIINDILIKFGNFMNTMPDILPLSMSKDKSLSERVEEINNAMVSGKISVDIANKLLLGLSNSTKLIEIEDLENRISELESKK